MPLSLVLFRIGLWWAVNSRWQENDFALSCNWLIVYLMYSDQWSFFFCVWCEAGVDLNYVAYVCFSAIFTGKCSFHTLSLINKPIKKQLTKKWGIIVRSSIICICYIYQCSHNLTLIITVLLYILKLIKLSFQLRLLWLIINNLIPLICALILGLFCIFY